MPDALQLPNQQIDLFNEPPKPTPCSWVECSAGHRWPPVVMTAPCPADQSPVLFIQQHNCPFCNEPIRAISLRVDFVPRGAGNLARCKGQQPHGESLDILLEPKRQGQIEAKQLSLFAERA